MAIKTSKAKQTSHWLITTIEIKGQTILQAINIAIKSEHALSPYSWVELPLSSLCCDRTATQSLDSRGSFDMAGSQQTEDFPKQEVFLKVAHVTTRSSNASPNRLDNLPLKFGRERNVDTTTVTNRVARLIPTERFGIGGTKGWFEMNLTQRR